MRLWWDATAKHAASVAVSAPGALTQFSTLLATVLHLQLGRLASILSADMNELKYINKSQSVVFGTLSLPMVEQTISLV
ncbi:hypothetical protein FA13DRAFT_1059540 [Coprinellus micaceus]|uniref:Uncharacterized protein n=1 Tax=Coprinellus micaceus TaxID=71717 RepID=A0A4Y7RLQ8_COPMI|nr:hypothetical protein FA13DRAFT_1059540 [Coprinellus micaceus]